MKATKKITKTHSHTYVREPKASRNSLKSLETMSSLALEGVASAAPLPEQSWREFIDLHSVVAMQFTLLLIACCCGKQS